MGAQVKTQVVNGLIRLFNFRGQGIDVYDQAVFTLNNSGTNDEEGKKTNVSNPLSENQSRSGGFLSFVVAVRQDQADTNCKDSHMTCRTCIQIPLGVDRIDDIIDA